MRSSRKFSRLVRAAPHSVRSESRPGGGTSLASRSHAPAPHRSRRAQRWCGGAPGSKAPHRHQCWRARPHPHRVIALACVVALALAGAPSAAPRRRRPGHSRETRAAIDTTANQWFAAQRQANDLDLQIETLTRLLSHAEQQRRASCAGSPTRGSLQLYESSTQALGGMMGGDPLEIGRRAALIGQANANGQRGDRPARRRRSPTSRRKRSRAPLGAQGAGADAARPRRPPPPARFRARLAPAHARRRPPAGPSSPPRSGGPARPPPPTPPGRRRASSRRPFRLPQPRSPPVPRRRPTRERSARTTTTRSSCARGPGRATATTAWSARAAPTTARTNSRPRPGTSPPSHTGRLDLVGVLPSHGVAVRPGRDGVDALPAGRATAPWGGRC